VPIANFILLVSCSLELVSKKMLIHCFLQISSDLYFSFNPRNPTRFPETQYSGLDAQPLSRTFAFTDGTSLHRMHITEG
jgi:hypothetical protein